MRIIVHRNFGLYPSSILLFASQKYIHTYINYDSNSLFYHSDSLRVYGLRDHSPLMGDIVDQLV